MSSDSPDFVTALARGLEILRLFNATQPEMTLSEVAAAAGVAAATARRSLFTLQTLGYVKCHGRRFLLTPRVLTLSASFFSSMNLQQVAQQYLQEVVERTGDSSSVAILDGYDVVYIANVPMKRALRLTAGIGTRYPAFATSMGRVLLAYQPEDEIERALTDSPLPKLTALTETDPKRLRDILTLVRENGYASVVDELDYGVVSVAIPVFTEQGEAIAAVNCSTSPSRIAQQEMINTRLPVLREAVSNISRELKLNPALVHALSR